MPAAWKAGGLYSRGLQVLCACAPVASPLWSLPYLLPPVAQCFWLTCIFKRFIAVSLLVRASIFLPMVLFYFTEEETEATGSCIQQAWSNAGAEWPLEVGGASIVG